MPQETVPRILGGGVNRLFTICHHVLLCRMDTEGFLGRVSGSWSTAQFELRHKAQQTFLPHPYLNCLSIKKKLPVFPVLPSESGRRVKTGQRLGYMGSDIKLSGSDWPLLFMNHGTLGKLLNPVSLDANDMWSHRTV